MKAQMIVYQVGQEYHEAKETNAAIAYSKQMFRVTHGQIDKPKSHTASVDHVK